ncbi:MAG: 50S ribosomal protein L4 [Candidatus Bathyarchaeota archaeon]|nr:50S ribosomal protein L4 [Candidatus Bathyarchaeota archaeon]
MMKLFVRVFDLEGKEAGRIRLPDVFRTPFRPDVIKRAVIAIQSRRLQPKGRDPYAGKRTTAESWGVGHGLSRVPRLDTGRAAFAPGVVGGRLAHPPVVEKRIYKKIPKKEKKLALFSAIAASAQRDMVKARGHAVDNIPEIPLVVVDDFESIKRAKDLRRALINLGVWSDIERVIESVKVRSGKGKMRGRKKKVAVGPLIVVSKDDGIFRAARNIPGVDVARVRDLNPELLAPGAHPGRLTVWTRSSIEELKKAILVEEVD